MTLPSYLDCSADRGCWVGAGCSDLCSTTLRDSAGKEQRNRLRLKKKKVYGTLIDTVCEDHRRKMAWLISWNSKILMQWAHLNTYSPMVNRNYLKGQSCIADELCTCKVARGWSEGCWPLKIRLTRTCVCLKLDKNMEKIGKKTASVILKFCQNNSILYIMMWWCSLLAGKCMLTCTSTLPYKSWFSSSVRVGGFVLFAHRTALLRMKWDGEQSAVNPIRKCT